SRLFVEWWRFSPDLWPTATLAVHPVDAPTLPPAAQLVFRDRCCDRDSFTPLTFAARGDLVALQPWRQVARFDAPAARLGFVTGVEHGSLDGLVPLGPDRVGTIGPFATHVVDVTRADAPAILDGGLTLSPGDPYLQLVRDRPGAPFRLVHSSSVLTLRELRQRSAHELFSLYDGPGGTSLGRFWIAGERDKHLLAVGGGAIFQVTPTGYADFRVRRYHAARGIGLDRQELTPDLDVTVHAPTIPDATGGFTSAVGVSASGEELVLVGGVLR